MDNDKRLYEKEVAGVLAKMSTHFFFAVFEFLA